ncbi:MAG: CPBP family intramembrane metalloprotease [Solobacterium sp.]|nr:CPBP family intramembrane metalloprotease [Solobacterium sp.]
MNSFFFRILSVPACLAIQLILSRLMPGSGDALAAGCFIILFIGAELTLFKEDTSLQKPEVPSLFLSLAAGFSFCTALLFAMEAITIDSGILTSLESVSEFCLSKNASLTWSLTFFLLLPSAEELVFRSGLQKAMLERFGIPASMIASVVSFCLYGLIRDGAAGLFFCFFCGILASLFFIFYENAWVCISLHIGCSISLAFLYLRYFFNPTALLVIAGISFVSSAALIYHAFCIYRDSEDQEEEDDENEEDDDDEENEETEEHPLP